MNWVNNLSRKTLAWGSLVFAILILFCVNIIAGLGLGNAKVDLTEQRLFTISPGTKAVLQTIDEPLQVKVYYSKPLGEAAPLYAKYFSRVRSLLQQYQDISGNRIDIEFIEPLPFSDAEDRAVAAGLQGIRINPEGDLGYFGLVAENSTDNRESVAFFNPQREQFLEYDLTKLFNALANPKKKVIGLLSSVNLQGGFMPTGQQMPQWQILSQIREFYEIENINTAATEIPENVDVLMLVQPTGLSDETLYAIDQFALGGGDILAMVDPVFENGRLGPPGMSPPPGKPSLGKLFKAWGVEFDSDKVVGDISHAQRVQFSSPGGQPVVTDYIAWISLNSGNLDSGDVVNGGIEKLNLASVGHFEKSADAKITYTPLIRSSAKATTIAGNLVTRQPDAAKLLREYKELGKPLDIAVRINGSVKSAFPEGKPKPADDAKNEGDKETGEKPAEKPGDKKEASENATAHRSEGRINAVLVADADFLHEQFWVTVQNFLGQQILIPQAHNDAFVLNALDNLSGGEALASLRGRGIDNRPFTRVEEIRRQAEQQFRQKEHALIEKLKTAEANLSRIQQKGGQGGRIILSEADKKSMEEFRQEMIGVRRELRDVQRELRKDIDDLSTTLRFANIAGMPILIALGGLGVAYMARRRRQRSKAQLGDKK